jgi:hypothetical protein
MVTAGVATFGSSAGAVAAPLASFVSAECTDWINAGNSEEGTELLATNAETILLAKASESKDSDPELLM